METPSNATLPDDAELAATLRLGEKSRGWWGSWLLVFAFAVLLLVGAGSYYGYRLMRGRAPQFQTAPATRGELRVLVTATGALKPVSQVDVGAEISGRIEKVPADFNQHVKKGEPLAELDTRQLRAQVERSQASLEVAEAAVKLAEATLAEMRSNLTRSEELAKSKLVSEQEVDTARAAFGRAEANLASAKAQVSAASAMLNADRTNLEKAVIRSPIDGMVISRKVEPGQTVAASFQTPVVFQLAEDLARMELHVDVDEADMGLVKEGQDATFTVDAYQNRQFPARIVSLRNDPHTVQGVVSYEAVLEVDNSEGLLRPGMTATASIVTETRKDALLVPNGALRFAPPNAKLPKSENVESLNKADRMSHVWTLRGGKPVAIAMKKGLSDGRSTEVLSGDITPGLSLLIDIVEKTK
jgi:HlyD family secretion protein